MDQNNSTKQASALVYMVEQLKEYKRLLDKDQDIINDTRVQLAELRAQVKIYIVIIGPVLTFVFGVALKNILEK